MNVLEHEDNEKSERWVKLESAIEKAKDACGRLAWGHNFTSIVSGPSFLSVKATWLVLLPEVPQHRQPL